jgi:phytoene dehydrogenase-like protein
MVDFAVVGSGIGGSCSALMLSKRFDTVVFEKDSNIGGCASTFQRYGARYNSGATTFAGYKKGHIVYDFLHEHDVTFDAKPLENALSVIQEGKTIKRFKDKSLFLESINAVHYHKKNSDFYDLIYAINEKFYAISGYYYSNANIVNKAVSLTSYYKLFQTFHPYLFIDAKTFITRYFGDISPLYLDYIDNQLLIVAQAKSEEVNFLTAALALGYQFQDNYYVIGGMQNVFEAIAKHIHIYRNSEIIHIQREKNAYALHTKNKTFYAKNIVLNTTMFDAPKLFEDTKINNYFQRYEKFDAHKSAFMLYLQIASTKTFEHHYQIIEQTLFPYAVSNSIFVSFGDAQDKWMQNSVTISIHVDKREWDEDWAMKKEVLTNAILRSLEKNLHIGKDEIKRYFSAKPHTFSRYINRSSLGGIPMKKQNLLYNLPSNDTPVKGLYCVGDTTYAAQGWPGVMMGVRNLERLTCKS